MISVIKQHPSRLRLAWIILVIVYIGLAAASWSILSQGADLSTSNGRHLLSGALANLSLVAMGIPIAATAYRQGKRWAWFVNLVPLLIYGIPMISLDSYHAGFWTAAVLPQVFGILILVIALLIPIDIFFGLKSKVKGEK